MRNLSDAETQLIKEALTFYGEAREDSDEEALMAERLSNELHDSTVLVVEHGETLQADYYVIYECDAYMTYDSMVIKAILIDSAQAAKAYMAMHSSYMKDDDNSGWQLKMGYLAHDHEMRDDGNILRELEDVTPELAEASRG